MMSKTEFMKLWSREAANQPGLMVETIALTKEPIYIKPTIRKDAKNTAA